MTFTELAKGFGHVLYGMATTAFSLYCLGVLARVFVLIFCFGYGCNT